MTTKAEQETAVGPSEPRSDTGSPAHSNDAVQTLPSIIVDPSLSKPERLGPATPAASGANSAEPAADSSSLRFSVEEAERFASSFRASWEPPAPQVAAPGIPLASAAVATSVAQEPAPVAAVSAPDPELQEIALPGAAKRRGFLLASLAIASFFALVALGLMSSRVNQPALGEAAPTVQQSAPQALAAHTEEKQPTPQADPVPTPVPAEPSVAQGLAPALAGQEGAAAAPSLGALAGAPPASAQIAEPAPVVVPEPTPAPEPPPQAPPHQPAAVKPSVVEPVVPAPAPPKEPPQVHLAITTNPARATLELDGKPVPNPFDASVPKGGKHRIEATAPGHRARDLTVTFDRDRSLTVRLDKRAAPKPRASKPRPAAAPRPTTTVTSTPSSNKGAAFVTESPY